MTKKEQAILDVIKAYGEGPTHTVYSFDFTESERKIISTLVKKGVISRERYPQSSHYIYRII